MSDGLTIGLVVIAIPILAFVFVRTLRHEDDARRVAGKGIFSFGYRTRAGWIMGIMMGIVAWWLLTQ